MTLNSLVNHQSKATFAHAHPLNLPIFHRNDTDTRSACNTGNSTEWLQATYPVALVLGMDRSATLCGEFSWYLFKTYQFPTWMFFSLLIPQSI
jgi:uncharacterized membrane protein